LLCYTDGTYVARSESVKTASVPYRYVHIVTMSITAGPTQEAHEFKDEHGI